MMRTATALTFLMAGVATVADGDENRGGQPRKRPSIVIRADPGTEEISDFIPLKSLSFTEIEPFCRKLMSPTGTLGYARARKLLIVHDQRQHVEKVRAFVEAADREAVNIRIEVEFLNQGMISETGLDVLFEGRRRSGPEVVIEDGKVDWPDSVSIEARRNRGTRARRTVQQVMALSGQPARLWVGRTIPDPSWLQQYRYQSLTAFISGAGCVVAQVPPPEIVWRDVGSALYVIPRLHDSGVIDIEVVPAVTYVDGTGRRQAVRVEKLETRVQAVDGRRVLVGGGDQATRDFISKLFGPELFGRTSSRDGLQIYLTPHVVEPREPARPGAVHRPR